MMSYVALAISPSSLMNFSGRSLQRRCGPTSWLAHAAPRPRRSLVAQPLPSERMSNYSNRCYARAIRGREPRVIAGVAKYLADPVEQGWI